jgi:hypothetical protein
MRGAMAPASLPTGSVTNFIPYKLCTLLQFTSQYNWSFLSMHKWNFKFKFCKFTEHNIRYVRKYIMNFPKGNIFNKKIYPYNIQNYKN